MRWAALSLAVLTLALGWLSASEGPVASLVQRGDTAMGLPLYLLAGIAAFGATMMSMRPPAKELPPPPPMHAPGTSPDPAWCEGVLAQLKRLTLDKGVTLAREPGLPLVIRLTRVRQKQAKRSLERILQKLATIHPPPRVRIELAQCTLTEPPERLAEQLAQRSWAPGAWQVLKVPEGVDIVFVRPDPRWG